MGDVRSGSADRMEAMVRQITHTHAYPPFDPCLLKRASGQHVPGPIPVHCQRLFIPLGCSRRMLLSLFLSYSRSLSLSYTGYFCRRLFTPTRALHTCTSLDTHSPDVWARAACHADAWPPGASSGCLARSKPMVCPSPRSASSIGPVDTAGGAKGAARHRDTAGVEKELALGMVSAGRLSGGKGRLGGRQKGGRRGGVSASHWAWGVPPGEGGRGGAGCNTCSHRRKRRRMGLH